MAVCFYRRHGDRAGIGSFLTTIIIGLANINYEGDAVFEFYPENYHCSHDDILVNPDLAVVERRYLMDLFNLNPEHNKAHYSLENLQKWHRYWNKYIHFRREIISVIPDLARKYKVTKCTCVYFRGNDKKTETKRVSYDDYLPLIPEDGPLWIQSDEQKFIEYMIEKYPDRAFFIEEFPLSGREYGEHHEAEKEDAFDIIRIIHLMAMAPRIVSNISNVIHVALIIRGHDEGYTCVH
jgi:hypothetical protein